MDKQDQLDDISESDSSHVKTDINNVAIKLWGYRFLATPYLIMILVVIILIASVWFFFTGFKTEWLNLLTTFATLLAVIIAITPIVLSIREKTVPRVYMALVKKLGADYDLRVNYKLINGRDMFLVIHHVYLVDWSTTPPSLLPLTPHVSTPIVLSPYGEYSGDSGHFTKVDAKFPSSKTGLLLFTNRGRIIPKLFSGQGYPSDEEFNFVGVDKNLSTEYKGFTNIKPVVMPKTNNSHFLELLCVENNEIVRINIHEYGVISQIQGGWPYSSRYHKQKIYNQKDIADYFNDVGVFEDKKFIVLAIFRKGMKVNVDRKLFSASIENLS